MKSLAPLLVWWEAQPLVHSAVVAGVLASVGFCIATHAGPVSVDDRAIAAGEVHAVALRSDGTVCLGERKRIGGLGLVPVSRGFPRGLLR